MKKDIALIALSVVAIAIMCILVFATKEVSGYAVILGVVQFLIVLYAARNQSRYINLQGNVNSDVLKNVGSIVGTEKTEMGRVKKPYRVIFWHNTLKMDFCVDAINEEEVKSIIRKDYPNCEIESIKDISPPEPHPERLRISDEDRPRFLRKRMD